MIEDMYLDWSFRLLHRSRTELLLLPRTRRLLTEERRRHWNTSLLDRTIAVVVHRRWWTREAIPVKKIERARIY